MDENSIHYTQTYIHIHVWVCVYVCVSLYIYIHVSVCGSLCVCLCDCISLFLFLSFLKCFAVSRYYKYNQGKEVILKNRSLGRMFQRADECNFQDEVTGCLSTQKTRYAFVPCGVVT